MECLRYMPSFTPLSALKHTFLENLVKNLGPKFEISNMAVVSPSIQDVYDFDHKITPSSAQKTTG